MSATVDNRHVAPCPCGALVPLSGAVPANADGMALSAGEPAALLLLNCVSAAHGRPQTFAVPVGGAL